MTRKPSRLLCVMLASLLFVGAFGVGSSQESLPIEKRLNVGDTEILTGSDVKRVAIGDPLVADVIPLSSREVLLNAVGPGTTVLYVWDAVGRHMYRVVVEPQDLDMDKICARVREEISDPRISVKAVGNTVILEGTVNLETQANRAEAIAKAVVERSVFRGSTTQPRSQDVKTVSRPEGDSFIVEKAVEATSTSVEARVGLRCPKVENLIKIEKSLDEVSVRTLEVSEAIKQALHNPSLTVRALPGSVVIVEGRVGTKSELLAIDQLLKGWEKAGKDDKGSMDARNQLSEQVTIVNSVTVDSSLARQVMVRAQVVDINRTALKEFGVDWGRVVFTDSDIPGVDATANVVDQPWLIGQSQFGPMDLFGGGRITRFDPIGARVRALEQQNKAKVLSEPNLLVLDGELSSMLVGGEVPIPVVQSAQVGSIANVTVVFKEFGVRLTVQPVITADNLLQLRVAPEVSSLDFTNAVSFSGFLIPAFRTRRAETTVSVQDGQSLIISGLIQRDTAKLVKQIPVLGDLPIIGELFKSRSFTNGESELVIIVTPQIVRPNAEAAAPAPAPQG